MTAWHRHTLDPVHTVHPTASPYDTPARTALRDTVRAFAMDEVLPVANELDPRHEDIPATLLDRMGELGLFGVLIPEDEGGLGLGVYEYCLVSEELAPIDTREISAARWGTAEELAGPIRARLLETERALWRYRVELHDAALAALAPQQ